MGSRAEEPTPEWVAGRSHDCRRWWNTWKRLQTRGGEQCCGQSEQLQGDPSSQMQCCPPANSTKYLPCFCGTGVRRSDRLHLSDAMVAPRHWRSRRGGGTTNVKRRCSPIHNVSGSRRRCAGCQTIARPFATTDHHGSSDDDSFSMHVPGTHQWQAISWWSSSRLPSLTNNSQSTDHPADDGTRPGGCAGSGKSGTAWRQRSGRQ